MFAWAPGTAKHSRVCAQPPTALQYQTQGAAACYNKISYYQLLWLHACLQCWLNSWQQRRALLPSEVVNYVPQVFECVAAIAQSVPASHPWGSPVLTPACNETSIHCQSASTHAVTVLSPALSECCSSSAVQPLYSLAPGPPSVKKFFLSAVHFAPVHSEHVWPWALYSRITPFYTWLYIAQ